MRKTTLCLVMAALLAVALPVANIAAAASISPLASSPTFTPVLPLGQPLNDDELDLVRGDGFFLTALYLTGKALIGVAKKALIGAAAGAVGGVISNVINDKDPFDGVHCAALGGGAAGMLSNPWVSGAAGGAVSGWCQD